MRFLIAILPFICLNVFGAAVKSFEDVQHDPPERLLQSASYIAASKNQAYYGYDLAANAARVYVFATTPSSSALEFTIRLESTRGDADLLVFESTSAYETNALPYGRSDSSAGIVDFVAIRLSGTICIVVTGWSTSGSDFILTILDASTASASASPWGGWTPAPFTPTPSVPPLQQIQAGITTSLTLASGTALVLEFSAPSSGAYTLSTRCTPGQQEGDVDVYTFSESAPAVAVFVQQALYRSTAWGCTSEVVTASFAFTAARMYYVLVAYVGGSFDVRLDAGSQAAWMEWVSPSPSPSAHGAGEPLGTVLTLSTPVSVSYLARSSMLLYSFHVPASTFTLSLQAQSGDPDLFVFVDRAAAQRRVETQAGEATSTATTAGSDSLTLSPSSILPSSPYTEGSFLFIVVLAYSDTGYSLRVDIGSVPGGQSVSPSSTPSRTPSRTATRRAGSSASGTSSVTPSRSPTASVTPSRTGTPSTTPSANAVRPSPSALPGYIPPSTWLPVDSVLSVPVGSDVIVPFGIPPGNEASTYDVAVQWSMGRGALLVVPGKYSPAMGAASSQAFYTSSSGGMNGTASVRLSPTTASGMPVDFWSLLVTCTDAQGSGCSIRYRVTLLLPTSGTPIATASAWRVTPTSTPSASTVQAVVQGTLTLTGLTVDVAIGADSFVAVVQQGLADILRVDVGRVKVRGIRDGSTGARRLLLLEAGQPQAALVAGKRTLQATPALWVDFTVTVPASSAVIVSNTLRAAFDGSTDSSIRYGSALASLQAGIVAATAGGSGGASVQMGMRAVATVQQGGSSGTSSVSTLAPGAVVGIVAAVLVLLVGLTVVVRTQVRKGADRASRTAVPVSTAAGTNAYAFGGANPMSRSPVMPMPANSMFPPSVSAVMPMQGGMAPGPMYQGAMYPPPGVMQYTPQPMAATAPSQHPQAFGALGMVSSPPLAMPYYPHGVAGGAPPSGVPAGSTSTSDESKACAVCLDREKNTAFGCGHQACEACAATLTACHMCRRPVTTRIKLYG